MINFLKENNIEYSTNVSLKDISTFKIGGAAEIVCYPDSVKKVASIVKYCNLKGIKYYVFGRCSNVVFSDKGLKTLIIKTDKLNEISFKDGIFTFGAGVMLAKASKFTVDNGYTGMEFAYGIPGSVGGAVFMNAGAYGGQMSDCVCKTEYIDDKGDICTLSSFDHCFGYRHSFFSDKNYIILSTQICLEPGDREKSLDIIFEFQTARKNKQPLDYPSAGSVFKRPEGHFAGKLIQDCNLKGASIGDAQVSKKHSGFIINTGDAKCEDVRRLVKFVQEKVYNEFGVNLECELKFIED